MLENKPLPQVTNQISNACHSSLHHFTTPNQQHHLSATSYPLHQHQQICSNLTISTLTSLPQSQVTIAAAKPSL
jgi:hypothetical protein